MQCCRGTCGAGFVGCDELLWAQLSLSTQACSVLAGAGPPRGVADDGIRACAMCPSMHQWMRTSMWKNKVSEIAMHWCGCRDFASFPSKWKKHDAHHCMPPSPADASSKYGIDMHWCGWRLSLPNGKTRLTPLHASLSRGFKLEKMKNSLRGGGRSPVGSRSVEKHARRVGALGSALRSLTRASCPLDL